jgi:hypothetical protein
MHPETIFSQKPFLPYPNPFLPCFRMWDSWADMDGYGIHMGGYGIHMGGYGIHEGGYGIRPYIFVQEIG